MIRYGHGAWHAVVAPSGVALLHPGLPLAVAERVWVLLSRGEVLGTVMDGLIHSLDGAPGALPDFAIAVYDPATTELRVAMFGAVSARVVTADSTAAFAGGDEGPWRERTFTAPTALDVGPSFEGAAELPLRDGIVRARILRWTIGADAAGPGELDEPASLGRRRGGGSVRPTLDTPRWGETIEPVIHDTLEPVTDTPEVELITSFAGSVRHGAEEPNGSDAIDSRDDVVAPGHVGRHRSPVREAPAPLLLVVSTGERYPLDHGAFVGRQPRVERAAVGAVPILVTVPSPQLEISRQHLELRRQGGLLLAVDLGGQNGTTLFRADDEPARLHPLEPRVLVDGDELDIGDGIVLSFEGLG